MIVVPVILAGGKGERFWPKSRNALPKQFLSLVGKSSMLLDTIRRLDGFVPAAGTDVWVSTRDEYVRLVQDMTADLESIHIVGEPIPRNTAPGIGLVAVHLQKEYTDAVMCVLPADHCIIDAAEFKRVLGSAVDVAMAGNIVTMGIVPDRPETGYGYIERGEAISKTAYCAERFVEKPSLEVAKEYLTSGNYYWNSGMFVFKVSTILSKIECYLPSLYVGLQQISKHIGTATYAQAVYDVFKGLDSISIDYGIMEKTDDIVVVPADIGWDDVGSWLAVSRLNQADAQGNVLRGDVLAHDAFGNLIDSQSKRLIVLGGVKDLVVVDCEDVLMICTKDSLTDIRTLVRRVREERGENFL